MTHINELKTNIGLILNYADFTFSDKFELADLNIQNGVGNELFAVFSILSANLKKSGYHVQAHFDYQEVLLTNWADLMSVHT